MICHDYLLYSFSFLKCQIWDIGGQPRFRSMWERYCRGVNAIVWALWFDCNQLHLTRVLFTAKARMLLRAAAGFRYMVDAADQDKVEASRNELHNLLDKPQLQGIPVSVDPKLWVVFFCCFFFAWIVLQPVSCGNSRLLHFKASSLACPQVLVLGNKRDLPAALDEKQLIEKMWV